MMGSGPSKQPGTRESHQKYPLVNLTLNDRWILQERLGKGTYGIVHEAVDKEKNEMVAVKLEVWLQDSDNTREVLRDEYEILSDIVKGIPKTEMTGFPRPVFYASSDFMRFMVMELLGKTIYQKYKLTYPKLRDVYIIGIQLLSRLEHMHNVGYLHLDLKADNIYFGMGENKHVVYLADFSLSEKYLKRDGSHRKNKRRQWMLGTVEFSSHNVMEYNVPSRRDDVESLAFVLIHLYFKTLPWVDFSCWQTRHHLRNPDGARNLIAANNQPDLFDEQSEQSTGHGPLYDVAEMKANYDLEKLCRGMPGMKEFMEHTRALGYDEKPNYSFLRSILRNKVSRSRARIEGEESST